MTILDAIGRTRLIQLRHMAPETSARILIKLEYENPTGSMKDRMALAMVEAAEADGRLKPGGSVVEYTGGSTGVSLAFVCAAKRIPLKIVTSEASSREKRDHMKALGASITLVPCPTGGTTKELILEMIETARSLASSPGSYWTDQLNNTDQLPSYERMGEEIWQESGGYVNAFVQSVGTAGSLRGISSRLRAHNDAVLIVAVEPAESAVLSGGPSGSHKIEGAGAGFVVPLWTTSLAGEIVTISTERGHGDGEAPRPGGRDLRRHLDGGERRGRASRGRPPRPRPHRGNGGGRLRDEVPQHRVVFGEAGVRRRPASDTVPARLCELERSGLTAGKFHLAGIVPDPVEGRKSRRIALYFSLIL